MSFFNKYTEKISKEMGRMFGTEIKDEAKQAMEYQANKEPMRKLKNDNVFNLASQLSGSLALNPFFDLENALKLEGEDPRQEQLKTILSLLKGRQENVQQQQLKPELSQTRLSLMQ